jgi:hypothetical protein
MVLQHCITQQTKADDGPDDMDTPQKASLMRELVVNKGSSTIYIETHNNQQKSVVRIPKYSNKASALTQSIKYKFLQEVVNIWGAGAENVIDGLHKGTLLWLWSGMVELFRVEFMHSGARAGVTCISQMSPTSRLLRQCGWMQN